MKVTFEHYGRSYTIDVGHDDLDIVEVRDSILVPLLICAGFSLKNVQDLFFDDNDPEYGGSTDDDEDK